MNRTRRSRLISAALAAAILLIAASGLPGIIQPSIGEAAVTRLPRPHPQSHLVTPPATLSPRPHPISHRTFPPGIDLLNPRPHPASHRSPVR